MFLLLLGEAKKGGNSVASMLWKTLRLKGHLDGRCANEINFVFDNCTGQNKNRMVTRLLFFMVKLKVTRVARAIFLVKGHTKNDCDRMFNLMKYDYRKVNCYVPQDLIELVNRHPQVNAVAMAPNEFHNWDALENKLVQKAEGILKNHVFTVETNDSNSMIMQEYSGAQVERQTLVLKQYQDVDWSPLLQLDVIPPPGLPDIKWNELYAKWGRFIPEEKKSSFKYYSLQPPATVKKKIAEQTAMAKKAREKRSRAGDTATVATTPPKKSKTSEMEGAQTEVEKTVVTK